MKALIIGGGRFVGLHLAWELSRRGHDVTILNRGQTEATLPPGIERLRCDRKDHAALRACLAGREFDAVFDIIPMVPDDTRSMIDAVEGRTCRFVHVSTASVYRATGVAPVKEGFPKVADASANDYGLNKQLCEEVLFEAHARAGFPAVAIRPGYIYGPHNNVYRESLFFDRVVKGRPVLIPGDGSHLAPFGYAGDLARLLILCAEREEAVGQAFNFSGEFSVPMNHYVEAIFEAAGQRTEALHFDPHKMGITARDVARVFPYMWRSSAVFDISKAIYLLGYKEETRLGEGLRRAFRWFVDAGVERKDIDFSLEDRIVALCRATSGPDQRSGT